MPGEYLPPIETLISGDVNIGNTDVYVSWFATTDQPEPGVDELVPFISTDHRVRPQCVDCGEFCLSPVEARSSDECFPDDFTPTQGDLPVYVAVPFSDRVCRECATEETGAYQKLPKPEFAAGELYSQLGRIQRAAVETVGYLGDYTPTGHSPTVRHWVDRTAVTRTIASNYYDDTDANTITSSVSRAIRPLIDDPPVFVGAYRGWKQYYGNATPGYAVNTHDDCFSQGETPDGGGFVSFANTGDKTPTFQKLRLRPYKGLDAAAVYFAYRDRLENRDNNTIPAYELQGPLA